MVTNNAINLSDQGVPYYNGIGTFSGLDGILLGYVLTSNGTGVSPSFQAISASGALTQIGVDTITGAGTNPVLPIAGLITFTGGQYPTGTFGTRVVTINSPSPGNVDVEVQISTTAAVSTTTDNGISHYDSGIFTVDANGFVSLIGGGPAIEKVNLQTGTTPITPLLGAITLNGAVVAAGTNPIRTDGTGAHTAAVEVQISQALAATDATKIGLSNFNAAQFTVDANGFVSSIGSAFNYTDVTFVMSPYTVLTTDYYISVNSSGGAVQLNFPNAPTANKIFIVKDRTGNASANNITLTTPGGTVTFDGLTTYTINSNYQSTNLLANATPTYEVF